MSAERLFAALAERSPEAIVVQGTRQTWRAAELLSAIDDLAARLAGTRVLAVLADNGPAWVMTDLAALRAGIVHLPLPTFFSRAQLAHALQQAGADSVLTDQPGRIAELDAGFAVTGKAHGLLWMRRSSTPAQLPAATAKLSFTSGSTGAPKGVCLSAAGLIDTASAVATRLADLPLDRHLSVQPLSLLLENTAGIHAPLLRGAVICVPGLQTLGWRGMTAFDAAALHHGVSTADPDSLILVPELLKAWTMFLDGSGQAVPSRLRYVAVGGARVSQSLLDKARAAGLPAYQGYGLTECGSVVSLNRPDDDGSGVGRPLSHARMRVVGDEVHVSTRAFLGYVGDAATAPPEQEFATGDLGLFDADGHLHLSGRRKNLLITSYGRNISPEWIESVLLAQPAIAQALVSGDGRPWLSAVLVGSPGFDRAGLVAAVQQANAVLPDYARVAGWIAVAAFTARNGLATGNGRPVRAAILRQHAAELAALYPDEETADVVS